MAKGPKPTPTLIKVARGNPGKRPLNLAEPQSPRQRLAVPDHISAHGRTVWLQIVALLDEMGILASADVLALEAFVSAVIEFREAEAAIQNDGRWYKTETTHNVEMIRAHPALATKSDCDRRIRAWCAEFGMTPSARSRIETTSVTDVDPAEEYFTKVA